MKKSYLAVLVIGTVLLAWVAIAQPLSDLVTRHQAQPAIRSDVEIGADTCVQAMLNFHSVSATAIDTVQTQAAKFGLKALLEAMTPEDAKDFQSLLSLLKVSYPKYMGTQMPDVPLVPVVAANTATIGR